MAATTSKLACAKPLFLAACCCLFQAGGVRHLPNSKQSTKPRRPQWRGRKNGFRVFTGFPLHHPRLSWVAWSLFVQRNEPKKKGGKRHLFFSKSGLLWYLEEFSHLSSNSHRRKEFPTVNVTASSCNRNRRAGAVIICMLSLVHYLMRRMAQNFSYFSC